MLITSQSPFGGRPIRRWTLWQEKGKSNIHVEKRGKFIVTEEDYYCIKIGYTVNGEPALVKYTDGERLLALLQQQYGRKYSRLLLKYQALAILPIILLTTTGIWILRILQRN